MLAQVVFLFCLDRHPRHQIGTPFYSFGCFVVCLCVFPRHLGWEKVSALCKLIEPVSYAQIRSCDKFIEPVSFFPYVLLSVLCKWGFIFAEHRTIRNNLFKAPCTPLAQACHCKCSAVQCRAGHCLRVRNGTSYRTHGHTFLRSQR